MPLERGYLVGCQAEGGKFCVGAGLGGGGRVCGTCVWWWRVVLNGQRFTFFYYWLVVVIVRPERYDSAGSVANYLETHGVDSVIVIDEANTPPAKLIP